MSSRKLVALRYPSAKLECIRDALKHYYPKLGELQTVKAISLDASEVYVLDYPDAKYVFRAMEDSPPTTCFPLSRSQRLDYENALLTHLKAHDVPVAGIVPRDDGKLSVPVFDACMGVVYEFAEGKIYSTPGSMQNMTSIARWLGHFHRESASFEYEGPVPKRGMQYLMEDRFTALETFVSKYDAVYADYIKERMDYFRTRIKEFERESAGFQWTTGPIHADYHGENNTIQDDGTVVTFDWELAGEGPRMWDVASLRRAGRYTDGEFSEVVDAYLEGYGGDEDLKPLIMKYSRDFSELRQLWMLSFHGPKAAVVNIEKAVGLLTLLRGFDPVDCDVSRYEPNMGTYRVIASDKTFSDIMLKLDGDAMKMVVPALSNKELSLHAVRSDRESEALFYKSEGLKYLIKFNDNDTMTFYGEISGTFSRIATSESI
jgi:Ser/Thr protein kinase RdoA (MazF antagonist)